uniref:Uncharacterized protein n=1 Tax=Fagus sylvatica TaxID=28930 RepID=A0A2N9INT5_FAGSY
MAKGKKKLMSSAPWRGEEEATEEFQEFKVKFKVTKQQPGAESVMHKVPLNVPRRGTSPIATTMTITMMIPSSRLTLSSVTAFTATTRFLGFFFSYPDEKIIVYLF